MKNIKSIKNFYLIVIFSIIINDGNAFAQQSIFQQVNGVSKSNSNLALPTQYIDSFLGQDKKGPYSLTWRNFNYGPGNPVWISVDNQILPTAEYVLDVNTGQLSFNRIIKRTQVVKVTYSYYAEMASKNMNPTMMAPLTFKLASMGLNNLNITTFNNSAQDPTFVLGMQNKFNGFTSNVYFSPDQNNAKNQNAYKLGYNNGSSKNGLTMEFSKNNKSFNSNYGKAFGLVDPSQNLSVNANLTGNGSTINFNLKDNKNLNTNISTFSQNAAIALGSVRGLPSFNFTSAENNGLDAKGNISNTNSKLLSASHRFSGIQLAYKNANNINLLGKNLTESDQENLSLNYDSNSNKILPKINFNRTNENITTNGITTNNSVDKKSISGSLSGLSYNYNITEQNIMSKASMQQNDQRSYGVNVAGNKRGFSGITFASNTDNKVSSSKIVTSNNQGKFGYQIANTTFNVDFNKIETETNGISRLDKDQEKILFKLPQSGLIKVGQFVRDDNINRDAKGLLVGSANDKSELKLDLKGSTVSYLNASSLNYSANGQQIANDSVSSILSTKIGKNLFTYENLQLQNAVNSNASISEQNRFNLSVPINKNENLNLQRTNSNNISNGIQSDSVTNGLIYGQKFGNFDLKTSIIKSDSKYSNGVDGYSDKQNISFNYKHSGNTNFSFSRNGDVNSDQSQIRIGSINDVYSIGTSLSILKFGFTNTVTDQATANNKRVFTTSDIYTAKLPAKGNMPSVELEKVNSEADDNVNIATTVAEKFKVTNKFGSTNISLISGQSTTNSINSMDDKSTLGVSLSANKNFNLIAEQQDQTIQSGLSTRSLSGQKFGLNLTPMPNTILSTFITENSDGANKTETYEYKAVAGSDKTLFKLDGVYKIRNATDLNPSLNNDSTNTSVSIKPLKNITLSGNYLLNPDDPTKPNILVPIERRQYSLAHKSGSLELIGSYSDTEYLKGTAADVLAKSNGNSFFGETSFKMNYRSGSSTIFNTEYKEQFSRSSNYRTNGIFSFGMNHSKASTVFSLTGTIANNYSNNWNRDYKAEAKLNYKF